MTRRDRRRCRALARAGSRGVPPRPRKRPQTLSPRLGCADRKALLLGTALASTLLIAAVVAPTPAHAQASCTIGGIAAVVPPPDDPIDFTAGAGPIICTNGDTRRADVGAGERAAIDLYTNGDPYTIYLNNSGLLQVNGAGDGYGIRTETQDDNSGITIVNSGNIDDVDVDDNGTGIFAYTYGEDSTIEVTNRGDLTVNAGDDADGISAETVEEESEIEVTNFGTLRVTSADDNAAGVNADTLDVDSFIRITNEGRLIVTSTNNDADGIVADTEDEDSFVIVTNRAAITTIAAENADAIDVETEADHSHIVVTNSATLLVQGDDDETRGIETNTYGDDSYITIRNRATITVRNDDDATVGIYASTGYLPFGPAYNSPINIINSGALDVRSTDGDADGIEALTFSAFGGDGDITIRNSATITVLADERTDGIDAEANGYYSTIRIINSGNILSISEDEGAEAIDTFTAGFDSPVIVHNSGALTVRGRDYANGIFAGAYGNLSPIQVMNWGPLDVTSQTDNAAGIFTRSIGFDSPITIYNSGDMTVHARDYAYGIYARSYFDDSQIKITNGGDIHARTTSNIDYATGILAVVNGFDSPITIHNSGSVFAAGRYSVGIFAYSYFNNLTTIVNTGEIGAESHQAIDVYGGGAARIHNAGLITGYVKLTGRRDIFFNEAGGVWDAKMTSFFGPGNDLLLNQGGGTVQAANDAAAATHTRFVGLETFRNRGMISMIDGQAGDRFTISNTLGGMNLNFQGGGTLGLDVFLDGPTSPADVFTIEGNVSGVTTLVVNNTNPGGGTFNPQGIPVIFATGNTPNPNGFFLPQPIDTGFVDYDLFFVNTGSGFWELRSFVGAGAHLLPQLATAAQDIWHQGSNTWFDRTADLRVSLAGGAAPTAYNPNGGTSSEANGAYPLTPAVWARGSGGWLDRDDNARTTAYGRNYTFDLDRDLETIDFQVGIDMGSYDVFGQGDALVFGVLGGFVHGNLDYDAIVRSFNFNGGQVGAYATYLNGGLFVDTLLNVHLYELSTATRGFPSSLNANTVGLRTDTGYRFGSFTGGAFVEPLATIEVMWADIDGFSLGGNTVSFNDEANVRGRLGLRAGTTMTAWEGTLMEPFVIGSLWSNLSDNNAATLVSNGTTFRFNDELEDVWGEISAGVNFFNLSQTTAVFAKLDVTLGDDVSGVGGKAGMRVNW